MINTKVAMVILGTACLLGCNKTEQGATWGAGIGALAGQAIGNNTEGTLIGAGAGALIGGMIGNDQDKQYQGYQRQQSGQTYRFTRRKEILNADGTTSVVGETTTTSEQTTDGYEGLPQ